MFINEKNLSSIATKQKKEAARKWECNKYIQEMLAELRVPDGDLKEDGVEGCVLLRVTAQLTAAWCGVLWGKAFASIFIFFVRAILHWERFSCKPLCS